MKKYAQITIVLGVFSILVWLRQFKGDAGSHPTIAPVTSTQMTPLFSPTPIVSIVSPSPTSTVARGMYRDGSYTGPVTDAFYGNFQVQAVISGGRLTDVIFMQYPSDNRTSLSINQQANVLLKEEALQAQSAQVDTVTGASDSSQAFRQSLASALAVAK